MRTLPSASSLLTFLFSPPLHIVAVPDFSVCLVKIKVCSVREVNLVLHQCTFFSPTLMM